jgi:DNA sulfur modification protein DndD
MRIDSIQLKNFRQFFGLTPKIKLAHGDENITVIHGMNGAGKTALLNAFTWILYGTFSKGFRNTDRLINKRAISEAQNGQTIECSGELTFEHSGRNYRIKKVIDAVITEDANSVVERDRETILQCQEADGQWKEVNDIAPAISRILPRDLHSYFFFDGERVEKIVDPGPQERSDLSKAVKTILRLEPLERTIGHLKEARKHFEEEMSRFGDTKTKQLISDKEQLDEQIESLNDDISNTEKNIEGQKEIVRKLYERIAKLESVKHLAEERDSLLAIIDNREKAIAENAQSVKSLISEKAYLLHTKAQQHYFVELIEELKAKGELPAGIKKQFVEALLNSKTCICGRSLDPKVDSATKEAYVQVSNWLNTAGLQQIEDRALELGPRVESWRNINEATGSQLKQIYDQIKSDNGEIDRCKSKLRQISEELQGSPEEEVSSLEKKLKEENRLLSEYQEKLGADRSERTSKADELKELESKLDRLEAQNEQQKLSKSRRDTAEEVIKGTRQVLRLMDSKWRVSLESQIQSTFKSISVKNYKPKLNSDYSIDLVDESSGTNVAFSQGESLVLSFSFISSIIEEARKLASQKSGIYDEPDDAEYPLIMDSPFGALDDTNRSRVASTISQLADQVITLVSKTQWREEVETAMNPRIGKSYVLTYYSPRENTVDSEIRLGTQTYPLIKRSTNEYEHTTIEEVTHA